MAAHAPAQKPALSGLAVKYGHPDGKIHKIIANTGKSGLTPVEHPPRHRPVSKSQQKYIKTLEKYQQKHCRGFTTQELVELESFAPLYRERDTVGHARTGLGSFGEEMPIHPLFARPKWEYPLPAHMGKIPLPEGLPGYWEVCDSSSVASVEVLIAR